jgi:CubicO group peptidase (beta-lactamase class C family)
MAIIDLSEINHSLSSTLADWGIPGGCLAIAVGEETYTLGYGVCATDQLSAIDANTIFAIGSNTKAFTSAAIGMLVDEGKLDWDDPVINYLPEFALADSWVTQQVTLRDLLCHRLGLERAQHLYYHQGYNQQEIVRRMRFLRFETGFRTQFRYANQQYGALGLIIEKVSGYSWDDFVTERIFKPVGMSRSVSGFDRLGNPANLAQPHAVLDDAYPASVRFLGTQSILPWFQLSSEPAGSILTTGNDLALWLKVLLADGKPLLSKETFAEITAPQMVMRDIMSSELAPLYYLQPQTHFWTYGLGWWVLDYYGEKVLMHGGQMPGFNSVVAFFPERKIGLGLMVNVNQTLAHASLFYALSDLLLGKMRRDWSADFLKVAAGYIADVKAEMDRLQDGRQSDIPPSAPLKEFAGVYNNDLYGEVMVGFTKNRLTLQYGKLYSTLELWEKNTFLVKWNLPGLLDDVLIVFEPENKTLTIPSDRAVYRKIDGE